MIFSKQTTNAKPVIIFHAGGFCVGSTELIPKSQISTLVRLGFVVVLPEYRLSPQVSIWDGAFADAKDCLVWTRQTLPGLLKQETGITVSPKKVVAMGQSAGGSLPLHLVSNRLLTSKSSLPHQVATDIGFDARLEVSGR